MAENPKTTCIVPGCQRYTRRFALREAEWICGHHWKQVPVGARRSLAKFRRKHTMALKRGDYSMADRCARIWWFRWERVKKMFTEDHDGDDLPPLVAEQLRKEGFL